jgi:hypothetical protein
VKVNREGADPQLPPPPTVVKIEEKVPAQEKIDPISLSTIDTQKALPSSI